MICNTEKKLKKQFRIDKSQPSSIGWARFLNIKTWDRSSFDRKRFIFVRIVDYSSFIVLSSTLN